jgi:hypothetical protein
MAMVVMVATEQMSERLAEVNVRRSDRMLGQVPRHRALRAPERRAVSSEGARPGARHKWRAMEDGRASEAAMEAPNASSDTGTRKCRVRNEQCCARQGQGG